MSEGILEGRSETGLARVDGSENIPDSPGGSAPLIDLFSPPEPHEPPENHVDLLWAIELAEASLLQEQLLRAGADLTQSDNGSEHSTGSIRHSSYAAPHGADDTRDGLSTVQVPIRFIDDSAPSRNPSSPLDEPENQDAATLGDVQSLLAGWERRCLLSTIVAPDWDRPGLPSSQTSENLKAIEGQITMFLTHILDLSGCEACGPGT